MPVVGLQYPVNLVLTGRRVLVVGGGAIARRKIEGLLAAGAVVHVVAREVRDEVRALPVTFEERPYRPADIHDVRLVITATDDPAINAQVFRDGEAAGVWVNAADDPVSCSFTLPAVVRQGPLMVTVSTGGHSPALATWLKAHVEGEMGPEYAALLDLLSAERERIKAAGGSTEDLDWGPVLRSGALELLQQGRTDEARSLLQHHISDGGPPNPDSTGRE